MSSRESFDRHSRTYASRVANPLSRWLRTEEWIVAEMFRHHWTRTEPAVLVDAACGTGDRLLRLFTEAGLPRDRFRRIVGLDFSSGMLDAARQHRFAGRPLYDDLVLADLTERRDYPTGDLVLCLWSVPNLVRDSAGVLMTNLAGMVRNDGLLIYDMMTAHPGLREKFEHQTEMLLASNPALTRSDDPMTFWRQNDDGTTYDLKLFTPAEIVALIRSTAIGLVEIWGYMHSGLGVGRIDTPAGVLTEDHVRNHSGLMLCHARRGMP